MNRESKTQSVSYKWLDSFAVGMSLICAVHCLITPLLIIALPLLATSFWVHKNFHLWMMLLVLPTTTLAVFQGCKKHKDKLVILLSGSGMALLLGVALYESFLHGSNTIAEQAHCNSCLEREGGNIFNITTLANIFGGLLLASAHVRNFLLCRDANCKHDC